MNKILLTILALSITLNAGVAYKGFTDNKEKYTVWDKGGYYSVAMYSGANRLKSEAPLATYKKVMYMQLRIAAQMTKRKGYNYFVITNSNISNLNGFPINKASEVVRFISLQKRKPSFATNGRGRKPTSIINRGGLRLLFKPVPSTMLKNGLISIWSVKQVLRDTKGY